MPAKNIYHDAVIEALTADGWVITHDPLTLSFGGRDLYVDLGAERTALAAERGGRRIAVEVQSFLNRSIVRDLEEAVGQYAIYRAVLAEMEPERVLWVRAPRNCRRFQWRSKLRSPQTPNHNCERCRFGSSAYWRLRSRRTCKTARQHRHGRSSDCGPTRWPNTNSAWAIFASCIMWKETRSSFSSSGGKRATS